MEIKCPSCGTPHRSEDHPGAFEINCVCGYAILLPDEKEWSMGTVPPSDPSKVPIALEQEDALVVKIETPKEIEVPNLNFAVDLTPPEELPKEMPYDPFEVKDLGTPPEPLATESAPEPFAPSPIPESEATEDIEALAPTRSLTAQDIVDRGQRASMGQFLGASYDLQCQGLERSQLIEIEKRCEKLLSKRPWLQTELRARQIDLTKFPDDGKVQNMPEILAVEIYMAAFELGGSCQSVKRSAP